MSRRADDEILYLWRVSVLEAPNAYDLVTDSVLFVANRSDYGKIVDGVRRLWHDRIARSTRDWLYRDIRRFATDAANYGLI